MSKKKRAQRKQEKANSPANKAKQAKKQYYASWEAKDDWRTKQARKEQRQIRERSSQGVPGECPLAGWEKPSAEKCDGCTLKCHALRPKDCPLYPLLKPSRENCQGCDKTCSLNR